MTHVRLIAPSFSLLKNEVALAKSYLESLGMEVSTPDNLLGEDLLCSHNDNVRFSHLKEALTDSSVDVILQLRGGYGLTRLIPSLLSLQKPPKEKLFIGFSDGSILHLFLNQVWDWPSLHGSIATHLSQKKVGERSIESMIHVLKTGLESCPIRSLSPLNARGRNLSTLEGKVIGGNLCLCASTLGTPLHLMAEDKILFFEDVDERGYRVDRSLMQLQQGGALKNVRAIIFGDFVRGEEADGTSLIEPVIHRFAAETPLPIFRIEGYGHGKENFPLPLNVPLTFPIEAR